MSTPIDPRRMGIDDIDALLLTLHRVARILLAVTILLTAAVLFRVLA